MLDVAGDQDGLGKAEKSIADARAHYLKTIKEDLLLLDDDFFDEKLVRAPVLRRQNAYCPVMAK